MKLFFVPPIAFRKPSGSGGGVFFGAIGFFKLGGSSGASITQPAGWTAGFSGDVPAGREASCGYIVVPSPNPTITALGNNVAGSSSTLSVVTSGAVAAGESIVIAAGTDTSQAVVSISDGVNTYSRVASSHVNVWTEIWACLNPSPLAGGTTITVTFGGSVGVWMQVWKISRTEVTTSNNNTSGGGNAPSITLNGQTYNPTGWPGGGTEVWDAVIAEFS